MIIDFDNLNPAPIIPAIVQKTVLDITGDGTTKQFDIVHNLNTRDMFIMVYQDFAPYTVVSLSSIVVSGTVMQVVSVGCVVSLVSLSTIRLDFQDAPADGAGYKIVII